MESNGSRKTNNRSLIGQPVLYTQSVDFKLNPSNTQCFKSSLDHPIAMPASFRSFRRDNCNLFARPCVKNGRLQGEEGKKKKTKAGKKREESKNVPKDETQRLERKPCLCNWQTFFTNGCK